MPLFFVGNRGKKKCKYLEPFFFVSPSSSFVERDQTAALLERESRYASALWREKSPKRQRGLFLYTVVKKIGCFIYWEGFDNYIRVLEDFVQIDSENLCNCLLISFGTVRRVWMKFLCYVMWKELFWVGLGFVGVLFQWGAWVNQIENGVNLPPCPLQLPLLQRNCPLCPFLKTKRLHLRPNFSIFFLYILCLNFISFTGFAVFCLEILILAFFCMVCVIMLVWIFKFP